MYDSGLPFNPSAIPEPVFDWDSVTDIPESGRGLFIIKHVMDKVEFSREKKLNVLTMFKKLLPEKCKKKYEEPPPSLWYEKIAESIYSKNEMELAVNLHNNIVSKKYPEFPGYMLFARTRPALDTGGDYIAFQKDEKGCLWFFVGDAMGKGMSAAIFTLLMHMVFKTLLKREKQLDPGRLLSFTNNFMADDFDKFGMFITALIGKIDIDTGRLYYASAGHCPPILYTDTGDIELLDTHDFMMGVDPSVDYMTYSLDFKKGMRFLAYTDGIKDITGSNGEMVGVDPLLYACASEFRKRNIDEACERIFSDAITAAAGGRQRDDISMLSIQKLRM
jgi:sigma-B regulation protein RsbU (phosphoserine phosphatase)